MTIRALFIGLPKTGTRSITVSLRKASKNCVHCDKNITMLIKNNILCNRRALDGLEQEYYTQTDYCHYDFIYYPCNEDLRTIITQYPDIKYVLNTRDPESWIRSFTRTKDTCKLYHRMLKHRKTYENFSSHLYEDTEEGNRQMFKDWFIRHEETCNQILREADVDYIVFDIEKDSFEKLGEFLGVIELQTSHIS